MNARREKFRKGMRRVIETLGAKPVKRLDPDMLVCCSRAADFDPSHNELWERWGNKSAVREDVHCAECGSTLAMSNELYGQYTVLDRKPTVCCPQCLVKMIGEDGG